MNLALPRSGLMPSTLKLKVAFVAICVAIVYLRLSSPLCWNILAATTAVAAFWGGRWEERVIAAVMTTAVLTTMVVWPSYRVLDSASVLIIDSVETAVLIVLAVRSRLWWPSWCAAFHIMGVVNHALFLAWPHPIDRWAYVSGIYIWAWLGLIPLSLGTWDAWVLRRAQPPASTPMPAGATRR